MFKKLLSAFLLISGIGICQDAPSGYTDHYRLRLYQQGARAGADSLNQNMIDIDHALYELNSNTIDANDFNINEVIVRDTVDGQPVFVGRDLISALTLPRKLIFVLEDTSSSHTAPLKISIVYNTFNDVPLVIQDVSFGQYQMSFATGVFLSKKAYMSSIDIYDGDAFTEPTLRGRFVLTETATFDLYFATVDGSGSLDNTILYHKPILVELTLF